MLYVHTNIFELKRGDRNLEPSSPSQLSPENDSAQIYDVTKITRKLDRDEIRQLKFNILNPNVDLANEDIKNIDEDIDSISRENDHKLLIEDASYGLKVRSKRDKLSVDQATFIKVLS